MLVTGIAELPKGRRKVFIDGEYAFMLYQREIVAYGLEEGKDLPDSLYDIIMKDTVNRRARQKALTLLERSDRTEVELRRKLSLDMYTDAVVDDTVRYLYSLHYLDDVRFTENYILGHAPDLSRFELMHKLMLKGISRETFEKLYEEYLSDSGGEESAAAVRTLRKKLGTKRELTVSEKFKVIGFMMRKGFRRDDIIKAFESLEISVQTEDIPE